MNLYKDLIFWATRTLLFCLFLTLSHGIAQTIGRVIPTTVTIGEKLWLEILNGNAENIRTIRIGSVGLEANKFSAELKYGKTWISIIVPGSLSRGQASIALGLAKPRENDQIARVNIVEKIGGDIRLYGYARTPMWSAVRNNDRIPIDLPNSLLSAIADSGSGVNFRTMPRRITPQLGAVPTSCNAYMGQLTAKNGLSAWLLEYSQSPIVTAPTDGMRPPGGGASPAGFRSLNIASNLASITNDENYRQIQLEAAANTGATGKGVDVYVIDTAQRVGSIVQDDKFKTFVKISDNKVGYSIGHGKYVGQIISDIAPEARVHYIQVCGVEVCDPQKLIKSLCDIPITSKTLINLSLTTRYEDDILKEVIGYVAGQGAIFVTAFGNAKSCVDEYAMGKYKGSDDCFLYPSDWTYENKSNPSYKNFGIKNVLSVAANEMVRGSSTNTPRPAIYNRGNSYTPLNDDGTDGISIANGKTKNFMNPKIYAPGAFLFNGYPYVGTSFAAPIVTGLIALRLSVNCDKPLLTDAGQIGNAYVIREDVDVKILLASCG